MADVDSFVGLKLSIKESPAYPSSNAGRNKIYSIGRYFDCTGASPLHIIFFSNFSDRFPRYEPLHRCFLFNRRNRTVYMPEEQSRPQLHPFINRLIHSCNRRWQSFCGRAKRDSQPQPAPRIHCRGLRLNTWDMMRACPPEQLVFYRLIQNRRPHFSHNRLYRALRQHYAASLCTHRGFKRGGVIRITYYGKVAFFSEKSLCMPACITEEGVSYILNDQADSFCLFQGKASGELIWSVIKRFYCTAHRLLRLFRNGPAFINYPGNGALGDMGDLCYFIDRYGQHSSTFRSSA